MQTCFAQLNDTIKTQAASFDINKKPFIEKKATFLSVYYGVSNYLGDLGGNSGPGKKFLFDNNFKKRTSFIGFSVSHLRKEAVGFNFAYTSGNIAGSDADAGYKNQSDSAYKRFKRNLDFQSKISEWSLLLEVYPLKFIHHSKKISRWNVQPYLIGGIGRFKFNPQGSYYDPIAGDHIWVDLAPLSTEGEGMNEYPDRKPYKLTQINLPYGIGVQYKLGAKTSVAFEYIGRKLFTDYLDDVSTSYIDPSLYSNYLSEEDAVIAKAVNNKSNLTDPNNPSKPGDKRGNSKFNDFYYSFNLKFSVQINKKKKIVKRPESMNIPVKFYKYDNTEMCD